MLVLLLVTIGGMDRLVVIDMLVSIVRLGCYRQLQVNHYRLVSINRLYLVTYGSIDMLIIVDSIL